MSMRLAIIWWYGTGRWSRGRRWWHISGKALRQASPGEGLYGGIQIRVGPEVRLHARNGYQQNPQHHQDPAHEKVPPWRALATATGTIVKLCSARRHRA